MVELWPPTRSRHARGARTSATALAVSRDVVEHASLPRARRATLAAIDLCTTRGQCTVEMPLSFGARPWCDVRAVASNAQPAFTWHMRKRHCAGCLSGGGKSRELAARARRAALVTTILRTMERYRTRKKHLSFGARPWYDVRAVTSNAQPAFAWHARKRHCAGCLFGGVGTRKLAVRPPCRAGCDRLIRHERALRRREAYLFQCKTVVRRASCGLQRVAYIHVARESHCAGCLSGCGKTCEDAARAPCRAGCDRATCYGRAVHRREASPLRYKTVVQRESCDLQRAAGIRVARERVPPRWLSLRMWQNTRACRARAVPRWLLSAYVLRKGSAQAGGLSPSVQDRGAT